MSTENHGGMILREKLHIRPTELSGNPTSHLTANQKELDKGNNEFFLTKYLFYTTNGIKMP
jgi:hypothetical protein